MQIHCTDILFLVIFFFNHPSNLWADGFEMKPDRRYSANAIGEYPTSTPTHPGVFLKIRPGRQYGKWGSADVKFGHKLPPER